MLGSNWPEEFQRWKREVERKLDEMGRAMQLVEVQASQPTQGISFGGPTPTGTLPVTATSSAARAKLTASLTASNTATAIVQEWNGTAWADTAEVITVRTGIPGIATLTSGKIVWYVTKLVDGTSYNFVVNAQC